jgi:hypothetical protein
MPAGFFRDGVEVLDGRMTGQEGDLQRPALMQSILSSQSRSR